MDQVVLRAVPNGKVVEKTTYALAPVDAEALRVLWPAFIRPGLLVVKAKDKESGYWEPEHVRMALDAGLQGRIFCECHLIMPSDGKSPVGFVITRLYNDEFLQVPTALHVWITYCTRLTAMRYVLPIIERRARDLGVRRIQGISGRFKWMSRLRKFGYRAQAVIMSKEVV